MFSVHISKEFLICIMVVYNWQYFSIIYAALLLPGEIPLVVVTVLESGNTETQSDLLAYVAAMANTEDILKGFSL